MTIRSLLFVPGARPDRFQKALAAGADAVCIDLEDAVPPEGKDAARRAVVEFLSHTALHPKARIGLRINSPSTAYGSADLALLVERTWDIDLLMIPKVSSAQEVALVSQALKLERPVVWPIVESGRGLRAAWEIAEVPLVEGLLFGAIDYSADIGSQPEWEAMLYARGALAAAAGAAGIELLDVPYTDFQDDDGLAMWTRRARAFGFTGRACIHPRQVPIVNEAFRPTEAEVVQARRVLAAYQAAGGAAAQLDGKLIELPVMRSAQRVIKAIGER